MQFWWLTENFANSLLLSHIFLKNTEVGILNFVWAFNPLIDNEQSLTHGFVSRISIRTLPSRILLQILTILRFNLRSQNSKMA